MTLFRQFVYKKFGILPFDAPTADKVEQSVYHPYIKILFLKKGSHITIDFNKYKLPQDTLFFINVNQWYQDPAYFVRLFTKQAGTSPVEFQVATPEAFTFI